MKKAFLICFSILVGFAMRANAYTEVVEVVRSSATVGGVVCSSGTASRIDNAGRNGLMGGGLNRAWVRIENQDSADAVWLGFDASVSTFSVASIGEKLAAGSNAPYSIGRDIQIWCKADDSAGAAGVLLSNAQFGFK